MISPDILNSFWQIDAPALLSGIFAATACAISGSFLLLQRQSMAADAYSHSILPGIVIAFLLSGSLNIYAVFLGGFAASLVTAALIHIIKTRTPLDNNIATGIALSFMFALGVFLLEHQVGGRVHLDAEHVLYGAMELIYWPAPYEWRAAPLQLQTTALSALASILALIILYRPIQALLFDSRYATLHTTKSNLARGAILIISVATAISTFQAMGAIMAIALFICPAASARLYAHKISTQCALATIFGITSVLLGYSCATLLPLQLGFEHSINIAGCIGTCAGVIQICAIFVHSYTQDKKSV